MQVSVKEAALSLEVDEETIYRWIRQGDIPAHRVNEEYRFNGPELLEWATHRGMKISLGSFEGRDAAGSEGPSLLEALGLGGIARGVAGSDPTTVLRSVVDALALPEDVDREYLFQIMMARESIGSTGIGDGIAIPHVRNPVVLDVAKPSVTLCFLERPIDFRAIDGKPVDIMFAIVSPSVRVHLHLLSRLGLVLRDGPFRQALHARSGDPELLAALARAEAAISPAKGDPSTRRT